MLKRFLAVFSSLLMVAASLGACSRGGSPPDAPKDLKAAPGDGQVVLTWSGDAGSDWWVFYGPVDNISTSNWTTISGSKALLGAKSPQVVSGLTNGTLYSFVVNGRNNGGKGGDESSIAIAVPRPAGGSWAPATSPGAATLTGIAHLNNGYFTGGVGGGFATSPDLVTWSAVSSNLNAGVDITAIGVVNGRMIVFGADGAITSGVNGIDFVSSTNPTPNPIYGLGYLNGVVIAVGANGTILRSVDGITFGVVPSPTGATLRGVTAGNNLLVAVGDAGTVLTSADGFTWTAVASGTTANLASAAFGNGRFVAVGSAGAWITSVDGTTWAAGVPVVTTDMTAIVYGSRFVGVGAAGRVMLSDDGLAWSTPSSGTTRDLRAVTFGGGAYVAVGNVGTVVVSR